MIELPQAGFVEPVERFVERNRRQITNVDQLEDNRAIDRYFPVPQRRHHIPEHTFESIDTQ